MYSREKRMLAIELYIKYDKSQSAVIHELGYPSSKLLHIWYKRYLQELETDILWTHFMKKPRFSLEQKTSAVNHYLEHGRCFSRTVKALGYPCRQTLRCWCAELLSETRKKRTKAIQFTSEQKKEVVIDLCERVGSANEVAQKHGLTRETLYNWKLKLLGKGAPKEMPKVEKKPVSSGKQALLSEIETLKQHIRRLKLEKEILEKATELLKKELGIDYKNLTNKEKTIVIDAIKTTYSLDELLQCLKIPRSSYFYHHKVLSKPAKYESLRTHLHDLFLENNGRYGYRRIHALLVREEIHISEKVVRRLMRELNLVVFGRKKRKFSSYLGENLPAAKNLIERDFHAQAPNIKWLTDITVFHLPAGKVFLSPLLDCFDGWLTSWSIGVNPDADLVNSMLDHAITTLKVGEHPLIHTDRGCHYRWPGWISRMENAHLLRSMSQKACTPDNAACEGFFGRLKNEMFYPRSWNGISIEDFMDLLEEYLVWYNEKRIKLSLGGLSPLEYRQSLGLV